MAAISHKALFEKLRDTYVIDRSEQYAHWTLPALMADFDEVRNGRAVLERDYQEIGALLVNHLSSKLARILFPTNAAFFKIEASTGLKARAEQNGVNETDLQSNLARAERSASKQAFMNGSYAQYILAMKHLIVTGNVLLYRDSATKSTTAYGLQSFVTRRDGRGRLIDCVLRESTYVEALPPDLQQILRLKDKGRYSRPEQTVEVYTRIHRVFKGTRVMYEVTQEVDTFPVGKPSTYPEHLCPWQVVTWNLIPGEHYARGLVEDYAGGFAKLSDLSEASALYSVEIMRVVHLVAAGSGTDIDDVANAETGEYVRGDPNTVSAHESGDGQKLQQVEGTIQATVQRLSRAFMYQANTRDAERVTAYELQQDALEAEHALGGVYSSLSASLQLPSANIFLVELNDSLLEGLVTGDLVLDISAGIPALGRSTDVQNLVAASQEAAAVVPVLQQVDNRISPSRVMDVIYAGRSIDSSTIMKTKDELASEQEADAQVAAGQEQMLQAGDMAAQVEALQTIQGTQ